MLSPVEGKIDRSGIRFRCDDEIELQLALLPVIRQVDARINVLIGDASVVRNIRVPVLGIVAANIVALARQLVTRS